MEYFCSVCRMFGTVSWDEESPVVLVVVVEEREEGCGGK